MTFREWLLPSILESCLNIKIKIRVRVYSCLWGRITYIYDLLHQRNGCPNCRSSFKRSCIDRVWHAGRLEFLNCSRPNMVVDYSLTGWNIRLLIVFAFSILRNIYLFVVLKLRPTFRRKFLCVPKGWNDLCFGWMWEFTAYMQRRLILIAQSVRSCVASIVWDIDVSSIEQKMNLCGRIVQI
jgi:hypothetical protein